MEIKTLLKYYNEDGMSLEKIAEVENTSKSTVQRFFAKNNFVLDKRLKKYISKETSSSETIKSVSRETLKNISTTLQIREDIDKALRLKSAIERTSLSDIVNSALEKYLDQKYIDMAKNN